MRVRAIFIFALLLQVDVSSSSGDECGNFNEYDPKSVDKCIDKIYESCTIRQNKSCTSSPVNNTTNVTRSTTQYCPSAEDNEEHCRHFMDLMKTKSLGYYFLAERYEEQYEKSYSKQLTSFLQPYIAHQIGLFDDNSSFPNKMALFCPNFKFKAKACQKVLLYCRIHSGESFCRSEYFNSSKDYIACSEDFKFPHADCDDLCNATQTKKLFGIDGIDKSSCKALQNRCLNVSSTNLVFRCEKRLKLSELCLVDKNETYAPCEAAVRSMSIKYETLATTLKLHQCYAPLVCFVYLKTIMLDMMGTKFIYQYCGSLRQDRLAGTDGGICYMMEEFCLNKDLKIGVNGTSYCGNYMKFKKEKEEDVETTRVFNEGCLLFVLVELVVVTAGGFAGARPYLDNRQIKTEKFKGERKKRAEALQMKRNHFNERDVCTKFHRLVMAQDAVYLIYLVFESYATNDHSYSIFMIVLWALASSWTYITARHLNRGLKENWDQELWTYGRKEYAFIDNTLILLAWFNALLVWRKYSRFEKLYPYRFWPTFISLFMAFGFTSVKIMIRWLLPLSVNRILLDEMPKVCPKQRRQVTDGINMFLSRPYNENDKDTCRKRKVAEKKRDELAKENGSIKLVKPSKKKAKVSKSSTSKSSSIWKRFTGRDLTMVVDEQQGLTTPNSQTNKHHIKGSRKTGQALKNDQNPNTPVVGPTQEKKPTPKEKNAKAKKKNYQKTVKDAKKEKPQDHVQHKKKTTAQSKDAQSKTPQPNQKKANAKKKKEHSAAKKGGKDQATVVSKTTAFAEKCKGNFPRKRSGRAKNGSKKKN